MAAGSASLPESQPARVFCHAQGAAFVTLDLVGKCCSTISSCREVFVFQRLGGGCPGTPKTSRQPLHRPHDLAPFVASGPEGEAAGPAFSGISTAQRIA
jgi:hypothetical protein